MNMRASREQMVEEQLISRGITDSRVLEAFRCVPRDQFVPLKYLNEAYSDSPLPIGEGQTISQPYMVALMTQHLKLSGDESVLEIGTGSGYQTAILAELAKEVYGVERITSLADKAKSTLKQLSYDNIQITITDGTVGWKEFAPYDAIIVTAAAPAIIQPLVEQLKDKGRLVMPIGEKITQALTVTIKSKEKIETSEICGCVFVPLLGKYGWRE